MRLATHMDIDTALCGVPLSQSEGEAAVVLTTTASMGVDGVGLVHGGFVFGAADHAAMLAVNDPFVVLGAAETRFLAPVRVGEAVTFVARRTSVDRRKHLVEVTGAVGDTTVFTGTFTTFVLDRHVLDGRSA